MTITHLNRTIGDLQALRSTFDLTFIESLATLVLLDGATLKMSELAATLPLSRAAMTTLADRLERAGMVERQIPALDQGDRRCVNLAMPLKMRLRVLDVLANPVDLDASVPA